MISDVRIHIRGRLQGLSARHAKTLAEWRGAKVVRRPAVADLCVIAHACAATWEDGIVAPVHIPLMSELTFRRAVGLLPPLSPGPRPYTTDDVSAHSGLPVETVRDLAVFDVLDGPDVYGFRDVSVARDVARLVEGGTPFGVILKTGAALRARGIRLNAASLRETPWGDLATSEGDLLLTLDGQMELQLEEPRLRFDDVFDVAGESEVEGDLDEAERLYRLAAKLNRSDGLAMFNLGNVLVALGRPREALAAFHLAAVRDGDLAADAHYNVAIIHRRQGSDERAEASYRLALLANPGHVDARHNLALLLSGQGRFTEAVDLWDALASEGDKAARRQATLCRLEMMRKRSVLA